MQAKKRIFYRTKEAFKQKKRLIAPLMGFPGVELIGTNIKLAQQNYGLHYKAIKALADTFVPDIVFTLMDLSVEANALGMYTLFPREEPAAVPKSKFDIEEVKKLRKINISFDTRVNGYIETMKLMSVGLPEENLKGSYVTGPYTLASLIMGAIEAIKATKWQPDSLHKLCDLTTEKIQEYINLLISVGAEIICILEPSASMLGPNQFREFSIPYIKHIIKSCKYSEIDIIYHGCGDTMHLIDEIATSGVNGISLDSKEAGIDLLEVAKKVPENVVIMGNVNPTKTMLYGTTEDVQEEVMQIMDNMKGYPNFILSTGCDLPQETPRKNIEIFMRTAREYNF
jgi:uroporphyrinogen decarboxylase